jgi:arylsulfatase A-like enzyme
VQHNKKSVGTLDIGATALCAAGAMEIEDLDGLDLIPNLTGKETPPEHRTLYWRFWNQVAIRKGRYRYLKAGSYELFFDLGDPRHEDINLIEEYPDTVSQMKYELTQWAQSMLNPDMTRPNLLNDELVWYKAYFQIEAE